MSANSKKTTTKGKRYTDAQKQEVVAFVNKVNADKGRGGQAAAACPPRPLSAFTLFTKATTSCFWASVYRLPLVVVFLEFALMSSTTYQDRDPAQD